MKHTEMKQYNSDTRDLNVRQKIADKKIDNKNFKK